MEFIFFTEYLCGDTAVAGKDYDPLYREVEDLLAAQPYRHAIFAKICYQTT